VLACWTEGDGPKKSFKEFRRRFPSVGHSISKRPICSLSNGLMVVVSRAFSTASICMAFTLWAMYQKNLLIIFL